MLKRDNLTFALTFDLCCVTGNNTVTTIILLLLQYFSRFTLKISKYVINVSRERMENGLLDASIKKMFTVFFQYCKKNMIITFIDIL